jgi:hypothetical protein
MYTVLDALHICHYSLFHPRYKNNRRVQSPPEILKGYIDAGIITAIKCLNHELNDYIPLNEMPK